MTEKQAKPRRGEIWYVRFDPTVGSEIQKTRPAVIVNEDAIGRTNMRIVVPVTGWKSEYEFFPWVIRLPASKKRGLSKASAADASQVKAVSVKRFTAKAGLVRAAELSEIVAAIALCVGYE